jgi:hypothetical protein
MANPWKTNEKTVNMTEKYDRFFYPGIKETKMPENRDFLQKKTGRKKRSYFSVSFVTRSLTKNNTLCKGESFGPLPFLIPHPSSLHMPGSPADAPFFYKNNKVVFVIPAKAGIGSIKSHKEMNLTKVWRGPAGRARMPGAPRDGRTGGGM